MFLDFGCFAVLLSHPHWADASNAARFDGLSTWFPSWFQRFSCLTDRNSPMSLEEPISWALLLNQHSICLRSLPAGRSPGSGGGNAGRRKIFSKSFRNLLSSVLVY